MLEKMEEHRGCDLRIFGGHCLQRMVADAAVAAANEQHGDRGDVDELHRVVASAARQAAHRDSMCGNALRELLLKARIAGRCPQVKESFPCQFDVAPAG